jgi:hypothetical protein
MHQMHDHIINNFGLPRLSSIQIALQIGPYRHLEVVEIFGIWIGDGPHLEIPFFWLWGQVLLELSIFFLVANHDFINGDELTKITIWSVLVLNLLNKPSKFDQLVIIMILLWCRCIWIVMESKHFPIASNLLFDIIEAICWQ